MMLVPYTLKFGCPINESRSKGCLLTYKTGRLVFSEKMGSYPPEDSGRTLTDSRRVQRQDLLHSAAAVPQVVLFEFHHHHL